MKDVFVATNVHPDLIKRTFFCERLFSKIKLNTNRTCSIHQQASVRNDLKSVLIFLIQYLPG